MRLRRKLYLSFGAVLMLGTLVATLMLGIMYQSMSTYKYVLETDRRVAEMALIIQADKFRISAALRGRLLHPYGDFGDQELVQLASAHKELNSTYTSIRGLITDPEMLATLEGIEKVDREKLGLIERQILETIEREESAEAEKLYFDEYLKARTIQEQLIERLNQTASRRITTSIIATQKQAKFTGTVAITLTILLIIIGCALSYYLTRSFERPIDKLMKAARAIVDGDLNQKLSLNRNDEIGEMAEVLNQMVDHLRSLNNNLADQVRWLRETKDELTHTQGKLIQQEKLAALGQLVAGVAHELNNPISFVYSNTILIKDSIAEVQRLLDFYDMNEGMPEEIKANAITLKEEIEYDYLVKDIAQTLEDCHEGARRVRDIVMNLKMFSRPDNTDQQLADVIEGIESSHRILGQYFRPDRVVLHSDYVELPKIECYPGQLSQVWMNLLANAAQAMNSCGNIWITSRIENSHVVIRIRDNGPGIPEENLTKIFDPFFTTKPVGEGTGLGLSIVHGIIERHDGNIRVESVIGVGTTFIVELPLAKTEQLAKPLAELASVAA